MKIKQIAKIKPGQDGAIFGDYLFRISNRGYCSVYKLCPCLLEADEPKELSPISEFMLDKADIIAPHSNSVVFGTEYYDEADEFPLLYSNIYNNYAKAEDKLVGVNCVYRIRKDGDRFTSTLVQLIEIGFTPDRALWRSEGEINDVRPYGNFVIDTEKSRYVAFVMRDGERKTRYFEFDMPRLSDGEIDSRFGVKRVVLKPEDILHSFDAPYHNYMQGAVCYKGKVYEVEGFGKDVRAAVRIIDLEGECEELYFDFYEAGLEIEPELIDFYKGSCIYIDAHGRVFLLSF